MALIKCKECGKEISTTAENCPHCGYRTAHGRSITKANALIVLFVVCIALFVVGFILILGNIRSFIDLMEGWGDMRRYYESSGFFKFLAHFDEENVFWKFILGFGLFILGPVGTVHIKKETDSIRGNGFDIEKTAAGAPVQPSERRWECLKCRSTNPPAAGSCVRCGASRNVAGIATGENIPTWKRVEMEKKAKEKQEQQ